MQLVKVARLDIYWWEEYFSSLSIDSVAKDIGKRSGQDLYDKDKKLP